MFFYGASGHSKVVIEAWVASGGRVSGVFDDNESLTEILQYPVSGKFDPIKVNGQLVFLAVGSNATRRKLAGITEAAYGTIVHPFSSVSPSVKLYEGTVVLAGGIINASSVIGKHVIINTGASVDHDCVIDDLVHIAPKATICGGVKIGQGTLIGAGVTVIQNISIGKWVTIGAGSVIVEDIPDYAMVTGVPGKVKRFIEPLAG